MREKRLEKRDKKEKSQTDHRTPRHTPPLRNYVRVGPVCTCVEMCVYQLCNNDDDDDDDEKIDLYHMNQSIYK